jgi:purine-binding chemotaxis protein CheW
MFNDEMYAIEVEKVVEVIEWMKITKVPITPDFLKGIINLRGEVIPVIDVRTQFDLTETAINEDTVLIIINLKRKTKKNLFGIIADSVLEVFEISSDQVEPVPKVGIKFNPELISGMAQYNNDIIFIIDIEKIYQHIEKENLEFSLIE